MTREQGCSVARTLREISERLASVNATLVAHESLPDANEHVLDAHAAVLRARRVIDAAFPPVLGDADREPIS